MKYLKKITTLRAREISFGIGQKIYRRNFEQSKKINHFNHKLADKFTKCWVKNRVGNNMYEIEERRGKLVGIYHAKDLKL